MTKLAALSSVLFSQFVSADAGNIEAQHDARLCAAYGAYFNALRHGNKTQLMLVQNTVEAIKTAKDVKPLLDASARPAEVKRAFNTYMGYKMALAHCGIPSKLKDATPEQCEAAASATAGEFVGVLTAHLQACAPVAKTEDEKAAAKAQKEKEKKAAEKAAKKEFADAVNAEVEKLAAAKVVTLADMVAMVADHIIAGTLPVELHNMLADATATAETRSLMQKQAIAA